MLYHILAVGDVVGEPGLRHLERNLRPLQKFKHISFTVVNGENASSVGVTEEQAWRIHDAGADAVTLGNHTFGPETLTDEEKPASGEFDCVLACRPEQIAISREPVEGALPVTIYANQPAGSETIVTLKAGDEEFLVKEIGQVHYDLDQQVWAIIDQNKINVYNKETTRLIKRAM